MAKTDEVDEEAYRKFILAGRILREVREEIKSYVRENMPIIELCEKAENLIREKGAEPAFPCNVSINEIAAHYTSPPRDTRVIPEGSLVKVDIGAHVDGYVTDTAITICFNSEYLELVKTAEQALKTAIESITPNMPTSKLGALIEKTIKSRGFKPISNLTGHQVGRYLIHAGTSLPNIAHISLEKLRVGGAYAVEPFVTLPDAAGRVEDSAEATIFRFLKPKSLKSLHAKKLAKYIEENFRTLPFTERWLMGVVPDENYKEAFHELLSSKVIMGYPVFVEVSRKPVAQAEHTVLIAEDECIVLT
ncbi:MAG: type II methionyl aminopeptidase [Candidatus Bathyarchaeota archaeon]|nr:type II methionyl aminopeptidase [Candidatus Bathyarchaeota archaeon]